MIWVLVDLFTEKLIFKLVTNFTDNHIGTSDAEIEMYSRLRASEYMCYAKTFFDMYDWTVRRHRLKTALNKLPPDYLFTRLFTVYKHGKMLETQYK